MSDLITLILLALAWAWGRTPPPPCPPIPPVVVLEHPGVTIIETTNIPAATAGRPYNPETDNDLYIKEVTTP